MATTSTTPNEAVSQYLRSRKQELSKASLRNHKSRLKQFRQWSEENDLDEIESLTGKHIQQFKDWRVDEHGVSLMTLQQQTHTIRKFVEFCESIDIVEDTISDKILIPKVPAHQKRREEHITKAEADSIRKELRKYHYATNYHVVFEILWDTACRKGALHALDLGDWHSNERYLSFEHRPSTDTPLKLKKRGERNVSIINDTTAEILDDYIDRNRHDVTDDYGRSPLVTTTHGRMTRQSITRNTYKVTRRCFYDDDSPCLEDGGCEGNSYPYSKCDFALSPHCIRRGAISAFLSESVDKSIVSGRANVSEDTLTEHYDARSREQRRMNRKEHLGGLESF